jgi:hypothetical protein
VNLVGSCNLVFFLLSSNAAVKSPNVVLQHSPTVRDTARAALVYVLYRVSTANFKNPNIYSGMLAASYTSHYTYAARNRTCIIYQQQTERHRRLRFTTWGNGICAPSSAPSGRQTRSTPPACIAHTD